MHIQHNPAVTGAFLMAGLNQHNIDDLCDAWDDGWIELVTEVCAFVPMIERMTEAGFEAAAHSFPGVLDYEVTEEFGKWLGGYVLRNSALPSAERSRARIASLMVAFFRQGTNPKQAEAIRTAVEAII